MKVNLNKPTGAGSPGAATGKNEIIVIEAESIAVFPPSDPNGGVVLLGNFVLKAGEVMVTLYSTKSKISASMETDGDEDSQSFKSKFDAQHPGNSREVKEFIQYWTGKNIIILHKACGDDYYEVMGTPCAPLQLKSTKQDNNDGRYYMMSFEPFAKSGFVPKEYRGALVFAEPFIIDANTSTLMLLKERGVHYKLGSNESGATINFDQCDFDHNTMITIEGGGGIDPLKMETGVSTAFGMLYLTNGTWTGLNGAVIHLNVYFDGYHRHLFELSRG